MKIQKVSVEHHPKAYALLKQAFPRSTYESLLVEKFHKNGRELLEWVCIHTNRIVAYIAFSNAYNGSEICGLHLAPMAVKPDFQRQGIGSELIRFALRQPEIKNHTIFVLGDPAFYKRFGFDHCSNPVCPFDKSGSHFMAICNKPGSVYTVGYEPEFY